jgi:DNA-binding XRE family transcriptional regulator
MTSPRLGGELSVSAILRAFLQLREKEQAAVREQLVLATDPAATPEQRGQAEEAVRAALQVASGERVQARRLSREECLSPEQLALLERMNHEEGLFAERLARLMAEQQMTQAELARRIGVGQSAISMLLSRKCRPQPRTLGKIAEALGVTVADLWPGKLAL